MDRRAFLAFSGSALALASCATRASSPASQVECAGFLTFVPSPASGASSPALMAALQALGAAYAGVACVNIVGVRADASIDMAAAQNFIRRLNAMHGSALQLEEGPFLILSRSDLSQTPPPEFQAIVLPLTAGSAEETVAQIGQVRDQINAAHRRGERVDQVCPSWIQAVYVLGIRPHYIGQQCAPGG